MVRHVEILGGARLQHRLRAGDLQHVEHAPRVLADFQQAGHRVQGHQLVLADRRADQPGRVFLGHLPGVAQHREFGLADAAIGHGVQRLALDVHLHQLQAIS